MCGLAISVDCELAMGLGICLACADLVVWVVSISCGGLVLVGGLGGFCSCLNLGGAMFAVGGFCISWLLLPWWAMR